MAIIIYSCFVKAEQQKGSDVLTEQIIRVDIDIEFSILFTHITVEKRNNQHEMQENHESMQILIVICDADQKSKHIEEAEVD